MYFSMKKHFEKQPQLYFQANTNTNPYNKVFFLILLYFSDNSFRKQVIYMQEQLIFTLGDQVIDKEKHWPLPRKGRKA